jgi:lipoate synthase
MDDVYCWSDDEETFHGSFATRGEAAVAAAESAACGMDRDEKRTVETAVMVPLGMGHLVRFEAEALLDRMAEAAEDELPDLGAERFEDEVTKEARDALQVKLEAMIEQWAREYNVRPRLNTIEQVREHVVQTLGDDEVLLDGERLL